MTKSAIKLLNSNKQYKNGVLTGLILAKQISKDKKQSKLKGGEIPMKWKKVLAAVAGPRGWLWLARHAGDEEIKNLQKKLSKYEPDEYPDPTLDNDYPLDPDPDYDPDYDPELDDLEDMDIDELDAFE